MLTRPRASWFCRGRGTEGTDADLPERGMGGERPELAAIVPGAERGAVDLGEVGGRRRRPRRGACAPSPGRAARGPTAARASCPPASQALHAIEALKRVGHGEGKAPRRGRRSHWGPCPQPPDHRRTYNLANSGAAVRMQRSGSRKWSLRMGSTSTAQVRPGSPRWPARSFAKTPRPH